MIGGGDTPFLPRGVRVHRCEVRKAWLLLAPERAMKLDQVGAAILQALDGDRNFDAVVGHLAETFNAPREQIARDAGAFLADLVDRRMVEVRP